MAAWRSTSIPGKPIDSFAYGKPEERCGADVGASTATSEQAELFGIIDDFIWFLVLVDAVISRPRARATAWPWHKNLKSSHDDTDNG